MKALIIGYGSIGKRHEEVLLSFSTISQIVIVSKQNLENKKSYHLLSEVEEIEQYDYFVIATETHKHLEQLHYLDNKLSNKLIFCEKPLFETKRKFEIKNNLVYIGYVLRFHPLLQNLKSLLKDEQALSVNVTCGQYLPSWRTDRVYSDSYSAKKYEGGGVLLDLSHEIDYIQWLFGKIRAINSYQVKISDLEIDSDDLTTFIGKTDRGIIVNLSIDYISKITQRKILVHTTEHTYELDFIGNSLVYKNKSGLEEEYSIANIERNYMFEKMHQSILTNRIHSCSYTEGLDVMDTISAIQGQNR